MNDLNLRVAALKLCAHPKRFAELRDALVPLPKRWVSGAGAGFVRQFAEARSSAEQVAALGDLFYREKSNQEEEELRQVQLFLADLLFASPLKHAVRNQLTKLFSDNALGRRRHDQDHGHTRESLQEALAWALRDLVAGLEESSHDRHNDVFVSANACLQNFAYGRVVLGQQVLLFLPRLPGALERYWRDIRDPHLELSPTRRNELYLYVQNALRFLVSLLSEWGEQLHPVDCREALQAADAVAQEVARHVDTPWDVRSIAGLLIGHLARFSGGLTDYLESCARPGQAERDAEREVPVQVAALLVLQTGDYQEHAARAIRILQSILAIAQRDGNVSNLLVYLSKHLFIYSKGLGEVSPLLDSEQRGNYELILAELQEFALQHLSSGTDSVRHMSSALFRQVLQHARATGLEELFLAVYRQFEERTAPLGARCLALEQLVGVLGVEQALQHCPSLFGDVFPRFLGCEDSVDSLFKALMVADHKRQSFEDWHRLWIEQLMLTLPDPARRRPAVEQILSQALQLEPQRLGNLLLEDTRLPLSSKLSAIVSVRQLGQRRQELLGKLRSELEQALLGPDDHTRLLALRFVVDAPRPSDPLTSEEADAIGLYLEHNANNPSAHLRQLGYGLLQKALRRLELGLQQHQKRPSAAGEQQQVLLRGLMDRLSRNLFPSANYGRRWLSLHLLRDCVDLWLRLHPVCVLSEQALANLEHCLGDSYEHNKLLAARLLERLQTRSRLRPEGIMELLLSLRPPDSATGAFQLQVYCRVREVEWELPKIENGAITMEPRIYRALRWCLEHLQDGLALARRDLAEAAKLNPLYGLLFASRHLLQQLKIEELAKEPLWRKVIGDVVTTCLEVSSVVLPVVSSASPEGHLPATRDQETDQPLTNVLSRRLASEQLQQVRTTPQMVLLCAWRSIKEVSLILGELVQRATLQEEQQEEEQKEEQEEEEQKEYLISSQQLEQIGELFLLLLAETKHRGAFEQAYVGFTLLCRRLWHSDAVRLNQLPGQWVSEAMALVSGEQDTDQLSARRLCPTRRSAGMPFMLQALICTELKLGTHATLHRCMQRLLEVCERRRTGTATVTVTSRSHALNILRALFRCSELAELVTEFVARGIRCALECLLAEEWAERNCATLLLAALVVRVFGVERARLETGELHLRNRMTGRIFFTRYPQLFDYFHEGLRREAEQMDSSQGAGGGGEAGSGGKRRQTVQLEAMLLMLSRLYPSALEGSESSLNLSDFVPFLLRICRSHDLMTRERAAVVVANFVSPERALAEIRRITVELKALELRLKNTALAIDANHRHGQLLLLLQLQRLVGWKSPQLARMQLHTLANLAGLLLPRDVCVFGALMDVMVVLMEQLQQLEIGMVEDRLLEEIAMVYKLDHQEVYRRCQAQGISPRFFQIFGLHLHRLRGDTQGILRHWESLAGCSSSSALDELKVELWLLILLQRSVQKEEQQQSLVTELDLEHFHFSSDIRRYYDSLTPAQKRELAEQLYESQVVSKCILALVNSPTPCWSLQLAERLSSLQPLLKEPGLELSHLLQSCRETQSTIRPGLVLALKRVIGELEEELELQHWLPVLEFALRLADPIQNVYHRHQAVELCQLLVRRCPRSLVIPGAGVEIQGRFGRLVLLLLLDEAEAVRHRAAQMLEKIRKEDEGSGNPGILPSVLVPYFLDQLLRNLDKEAMDSTNSPLRLFQLIAEPFLAKDKEVDLDLEADAEVEADVFDKQEINLYCESLLVLCQV
ncbi:hypothetical protein KR009_001752, partial [Drosophila setifemur]